MSLYRKLENCEADIVRCYDCESQHSAGSRECEQQENEVQEQEKGGPRATECANHGSEADFTENEYCEAPRIRYASNFE